MCDVLQKYYIYSYQVGNVDASNLLSFPDRIVLI